MSFRVLRIAAIAALLVAGRAAAQSGTWLSRGPKGGTVYCLVADPSRPATLYAGTDFGVYKSDDGGTTWRASNAGLSLYRVQTIAIDPTSTSTLFAGTVTPDGVESVGIFKSTDSGANWTDANEGLTDPFTGISPVDIESLAFDPRHPGTIWAGGRFSEIFQSIDGGATWRPETLGGASSNLETTAFQFDSANALTILAASSIGLLRSTDGGTSWFQFGNAGVPFLPLVADPSASGTLYAGNSGGSGIYKSTDSGSHWTAINKGLPTNQASGFTFLPLVTSLAVDPSRPGTVYAATYGNGLFQSTDGGANWSPVGTAIRSPYLWSVLLAPGQSSTVYAGTVGGGIYRSTDTGKTFSAVNDGFARSLAYALVPDARSASTYYAAVYDGIYKSTDAGGSWQPANNGVPNSPVVALVSRPGSPQTLFAGTRGSGLFKSTDGAGTWTSSSQGLDSYVSSIAIDPSAPATFYAGTQHPYNGSNSQRIYKSTDGGATWTQTSLDAGGFSITAIAINPGKTSQVIGVSQGALGYFQSLDSGKTWSAVNTDANCGGVNGVFFDSSGATTYLAGGFGLCRSTDGGKTWTLSSIGALTSVQTLRIDPANPSLLFAGTAPSNPAGTGGVFKSTDGGQTWQQVGSGLELSSVAALAINTSSGTFLAATHGDGIAQLVTPQGRQSVQRPTSPAHQPRTLNAR
jgi:photosystem II stability/assembly factor-like uncharacterized protein